MNPSSSADLPARIRVLESIRALRPTTNPYITTLFERLSRSVTVELFSWRTALFSRYDIFHVHWPELIFSRASAPRQALHSGLFFILLTRLALRGTPIVRTLHNVSPHEKRGAVTRALLRMLDRRTTLWIALNPVTTPPAGRVVVIPHPHYRDWYEDFSKLSPVLGQIGFFGQVRDYKNVDSLLGAFSDIHDPALALMVWGSAGSPQLEERLRAVAPADERVDLRFEHVQDAELSEMITASQLIVLPYKEMSNSGAVLLALSLDRPVLVPQNAVTDALAAEVGEGWVIRYPGELTAEVLQGALETSSVLPASRPDLNARSWDAIAAMHETAFREAIDSPRRR
jgi:beta-1,4-mannosyltransferase